MFENWTHIGARSFYTIGGLSSSCYPSFGECMADFKGERTVDGVAVLEVLMKNYPLGNRTLMKGVSRSPFLSKPDGKGGWQQFSPPQHGSVQASPLDVSKHLRSLLYTELTNFVEKRKKVGLLLSGGMDSRIVAGLLREAQLKGDYVGDVVALNWGCRSSRDVKYGKDIAQMYGWEYLHFPLSAEVLYNNIHIAGNRGAEFSPVHLHAMAAISKLGELDGFLAGSYGDSIGRGEYSGIPVQKLKPILSKDLNVFSFMKKKSESLLMEYVKDDVAASNIINAEKTGYQKYEVEMQMHYMRRQLNSCMSIIDDAAPLYQMFTSPDVVGYVWQLSPESRNDSVYYHLLEAIDASLLDVPWARTGARYLSKSKENADGYSSLNNCYGIWARRDLYGDVKKIIEEGSLFSLGLFNERAIEGWLKEWPKSNGDRADRLDEKMLWLASLSLFVKNFDVSGVGGCENTFKDLASERYALVRYKAYKQALKVLKR